MALVSIEMSEYKAMEEKSALLEKALNNEKSLQEEIKAVERRKNQELSDIIEEKAVLIKEANDKTIKAYQEAKMKVVKVTKRVSKQYLMAKRDDQQIVIHEFLKALGLDVRQIEQIKEVSARRFSINYGSSGQAYYSDSLDLDRLRNALYKSETVEDNDVTTVTIHGLDEVKEELKKDLESQINEETLISLEKAKETSIQNSKLILDKMSLYEELQELKNTHAAHILSYVELQKTLGSTNNLHEQELDSIKQQLDDLVFKYNRLITVSQESVKRLTEEKEILIVDMDIKVKKFESIATLLSKATTFWQKIKLYWIMKNIIKDKTWFN